MSVTEEHRQKEEESEAADQASVTETNRVEKENAETERLEKEMVEKEKVPNANVMFLEKVQFDEVAASLSINLTATKQYLRKKELLQYSNYKKHLNPLSLEYKILTDNQPPVQISMELMKLECYVNAIKS